MVVKLLDARGVFHRYDRCPACGVVVDDDEAVQVNDAVTDRDLKPRRPPVGCFQGADNPVTDVFIIRRGIRNLPGHASDGLKQVRTGDNTDQFIVPQHWQALDAVLLHQVHQFIQRRIFVRRDGMAGHDVFDFTAAFMDEIVGRIGWTEKELKPACSLLLGADLWTSQEIAFRDEAD